MAKFGIWVGGRIKPFSMDVVQVGVVELIISCGLVSIAGCHLRSQTHFPVHSVCQMYFEVYMWSHILVCTSYIWHQLMSKMQWIYFIRWNCCINQLSSENTFQDETWSFEGSGAKYCRWVLGRGPNPLPNYDIIKDGGNLDCIWAIQFPYQIFVAISGHHFLSPILRNHINHETLNFHQQYPRVARNGTFRLLGLTNTNSCTTTAS